MTIYAGYGRFCYRPPSIEVLEPLVTKAKQAYIDAVLNDNYRDYEEHFIAEYLAKALK